MKKAEVARTERNRIQSAIQDLQHHVVPRQPLSERWQEQARVQVTDFQVFLQSKCNSSDASLMMEKEKHLFKKYISLEEQDGQAPGDGF